ncbi:MAG: aspartate carbamoyltransferase [Bdellovibrionia bacterium]
MFNKKSRTHFIDFQNWSPDLLQNFFKIVDDLELLPKPTREGATGALLFFEPSTRTRISYETAMWREGMGPLLLDSVTGTSLEKGETLEDTIYNVAAMEPEVLVVRAGDEVDFKDLSEKINIPILCAGWGKQSHPSQALLDLYTLRQHFGRLQGLKLLVVGDVVHSRVVSSLLTLIEKTQIEVAFAAPKEFLPPHSSIKTFHSLSEGLQWSEAAMFLRVQLERHQQHFDKELFIKNFAWDDEKHFKILGDRKVILHPGPVNYGVELSAKAARSSQSLILQQVTNGVKVRRALLKYARGLI